ncbi:nucleoside recognition domain-containing protein [Dialister sp.]|uniref:nucleoside recognition domain-containing protein n=1 Tax=Dialister sp. TaxID=1955814 RepID=UPI002E8166EF|nr:nucleoside recognition domain-containing protein [Dialister sp.]MEE3453423.1 nucleoside recognition domain-containing protein [Dialister sp.]
MAEPAKKPTSAPALFMLGAKKGFYITIELIAPAMVMAYALIAFLKISGIMPIIGQVLGPVMAIFGLPGEASVVLLAAFFAKAAGAATAASMYMQGSLTAAQATILFPACITMGTLIGHFARVVLVCKVRTLYYPVLLITPIIDAVIVMFITRAVLLFMGF